MERSREGWCLFYKSIKRPVMWPPREGGLFFTRQDARDYRGRLPHALREELRVSKATLTLKAHG